MVGKHILLALIKLKYVSFGSVFSVRQVEESVRFLRIVMVRLTKVRLTKVRLTKVRLTKVRLTKVRLTKVS